ncbi:MAG: lytic transglycosylase domain-containing protein [Novosphingobium sp.]
MPSRGLADVLEIGADGATWVSGGRQLENAYSQPPQEPSRLPVAAPQIGSGLLPATPAILTEVDPAAGPAQWRARVAELSVKYDISPALLEAVVWQESRWRPGLTSSAGARGLAQLMPGTARTLGVNPDDPNSNLEGGARYLRMQLDAFSGNIEKALAAYNAGPKRVIDAGGVPRIRETQDYVAAILGRLSAPVGR